MWLSTINTYGTSIGNVKPLIKLEMAIGYHQPNLENFRINHLLPTCRFLPSNVNGITLEVGHILLEIIFYEVDLWIILILRLTKVNVYDTTVHADIITNCIILKQDVWFGNVSQIYWRYSLIKVFKLVILSLWVIVIEKVDVVIKNATIIIHWKLEDLLIVYKVRKHIIYGRLVEFPRIWKNSRRDKDHILKDRVRGQDDRALEGLHWENDASVKGELTLHLIQA